MDLLGVTALMSFLERWNWGLVTISDLALSHHRFLSLWLCSPPQKFLHTPLSGARHWVGPRKSASNRVPHLLRPALHASTTTDYDKTVLLWHNTTVVGNWGLRGPALFFVCLFYQLLNDAQKLHCNTLPQGPCLSQGPSVFPKIA